MLIGNTFVWGLGTKEHFQPLNFIRSGQGFISVWKRHLKIMQQVHNNIPLQNSGKTFNIYLLQFISLLKNVIWKTFCHRHHFMCSVTFAQIIVSNHRLLARPQMLVKALSCNKEAKNAAKNFPLDRWINIWDWFLETKDVMF